MMTLTEVQDAISRAKEIHETWDTDLADDDWAHTQGSREEIGGTQDWHQYWVEVYEATLFHLRGSDGQAM